MEIDTDHTKWLAGETSTEPEYLVQQVKLPPTMLKNWMIAQSAERETRGQEVVGSISLLVHASHCPYWLSQCQFNLPS